MFKNLTEYLLKTINCPECKQALDFSKDVSIKQQYGYGVMQELDLNKPMLSEDYYKELLGAGWTKVKPERGL